MDIKIKALLCFAPFGIAAAVGTSLAAPAYDAYQQRAANVEDKKREQGELDSKLANKAKIQKEKADLESAIETLRASVPKKPELEILNLDVEKMALDSGLELISVKKPDQETLRKAGIETDITPENAGTNMSKGKEQLANRVKATVAPAANAANAAASAVAGATKGKGKDASVPPDGGLLKSMVQIKLMGPYKSLMTFTHKLETYQRVVAITDMRAVVPKGEQSAAAATSAKKVELPDDSEPTESDVQGDPNKLNITMLLTTYYLP